MTEKPITFNRQEALRYFRARSGDEDAEALVDAAYEKLKNELQPRYTVKRCGCRAGGNTVTLENGTVFRSKALARYVGGAKELFLFGATLGSRVDTALRRMAVTSVAAAGAGQAVAAALIETYCDDCCDLLRQKLPEGQMLKWRFSPGYGDWSLEEQKLLFPVLDCARTIGLTLTESCMMAPVKSVTAVMAIEETAAEGKREKSPGKTRPEQGIPGPDTGCGDGSPGADLSGGTESKCRRCGKTDCEFRTKFFETASGKREL